MIIDIGLSNSNLYQGCEIEMINGRHNLRTPVKDAIIIVGANIERMMSTLQAAERDSVVLTGRMAIWAYLVVFHAVVHRFREVYYDDGYATGGVLIARHG
jgi:hypothetical protein